MLTCTLQFPAPQPHLQVGADITITGPLGQARYQIVILTIKRALAWDFSQGWPGVLVLVWLYTIGATAPSLDREPLLTGWGAPNVEEESPI